MININNSLLEIRTILELKNNIIGAVLNEKIVDELQLNPKEKEMESINLIVSTNKATFDVAVKGPEISRKDKMIEWGLWLPYEAIVNSTDQVIPYLKYYCDALILLLPRYGISEERIQEVWIGVEEEIIGNSEYIYEKDDLDLDLSDLDLD
jgi:hypothetical protein